MRGLVILFLVPGFSLGLVAGVTHVVGPLDTVSAQQTSLVWSNRIFTTRRDFSEWLVSRGSNYELWSQRHPVAARHFDDASRSLAANATAQDPSGRTQSSTALLITIISCAALLALMALPRLVRSARFLLDPPGRGIRLGRPPLPALAAIASRSAKGARAARWSHAPGKPRSGLLPESVRFDWRRGWTSLDLATRSNSRLVRHYLPRLTFYATAVVLSFAIGAWVAIYLR